MEGVVIVMEVVMIGIFYVIIVGIVVYCLFNWCDFYFVLVGIVVFLGMILFIIGVVICMLWVLM